MQTTGHRVGAVVAAELAAGVQLGHHDVDGGDAGGVHGHRDAAAVVGDLDAAVLQNLDVDGVGVAGHRLVDRVVDDFPDQVVQSALTGGADVHAGAFADRFQPLQDRDGVSAVLFRIFLLGSHGRKALLGVARAAVR